MLIQRRRSALASGSSFGASAAKLMDPSIKV
jgi:hypothetical protein